MHLDKQMIQNRGIRVEAETLQNKLLRVVDQIELKLSQIPSMVKIEFKLEKSVHIPADMGYGHRPLVYSQTS